MVNRNHTATINSFCFYSCFRIFMFENVSIKKFKKIIVFKYTFQLIIIHAVLGTVISLILFSVEWIRLGWTGAIQSFFVDFPGYIIGYAGSLFCNLANILSVIPYFKLILDCVKGGEEEKIIYVQNIVPNYELQTLRSKKKFMCDTFSRKKNVELLIYDENKNKYRLYWNENYGTFDEKVLAGNTLTIQYFKRSKIIFGCNATEP